MQWSSLTAFAIMSVFISGCRSPELDKDAGYNSKCNSLNALLESLEEAVESNNGERVFDLCYTNGMSDELIQIMRQSLIVFLVNEKLTLTEIRAVAFEDYTPKREVPGELDGRKLEFLRLPTHWIIVNKARKGDGVSASAEVELPVCEIDGDWKILGSRYKQQ